MHNTLKLMASGLLAAVLLTACGGGGGGGEGGGDPTPPPVVVLDVVPDEARLSAEAFTAWARSLQPSETAEPLGMGGLEAAPASDTLEPSSLD